MRRTAAMDKCISISARMYVLLYLGQVALIRVDTSAIMFLFEWLRRRLLDETFSEARSLTVSCGVALLVRMLAIDQREASY